MGACSCLRSKHQNSTHLPSTNNNLRSKERLPLSTRSAQNNLEHSSCEKGTFCSFMLSTLQFAVNFAFCYQFCIGCLSASCLLAFIVICCYCHLNQSHPRFHDNVLYFVLIHRGTGRSIHQAIKMSRVHSGSGLDTHVSLPAQLNQRRMMFFTEYHFNDDGFAKVMKAFNKSMLNEGWVRYFHCLFYS